MITALEISERINCRAISEAESNYTDAGVHFVVSFGNYTIEVDSPFDYCKNAEVFIINNRYFGRDYTRLTEYIIKNLPNLAWVAEAAEHRCNADRRDEQCHREYLIGCMA